MTIYHPISLKLRRTAFLMLPQLLIVKTRRKNHFKLVFWKILKSSNPLFMNRSGSNYMYKRVISSTLLRRCLY